MGQTAYDDEVLLSLVKSRLNRLPTDTTLDEVLRVRIKSAKIRLRRKGIILDEQSADDALLTVDYAVWLYHNRDNKDKMPEWLRLSIQDRWLWENPGAFPYAP